MKHGFTDMHSHIIPFVDDGAASIEEMEAMLKRAYADGTRTLIATPHHHPRRGHKDVQTIEKNFQYVAKAATAIAADFQTVLGTEIYFTQDTIKALETGEVLTINGTRNILVEFSHNHETFFVHQSLQQLQLTGYHVVLAHVERYPSLVADIDEVMTIKKMGIDISVNADSITGKNGWKIKRFVHKLLKEGVVDCVGSDAHDIKNRPPTLKEAYAMVRKKFGEDYADQIFSYNATTLIKGD